MLVLTRKLNEKIKIGNDITITVIKLRNNQIRLGIEAPRDVRVLRAELENLLGDSTLLVSEDSEAAQSGKPAEEMQSFRRIDVVDGLVSAEEMIAAGFDSDDDGEHQDAPSQQPAGDHGSPRLQVFSGRISADGELRENTPSRPKMSPAPRAPLAAYFTAP